MSVTRILPKSLPTTFGTPELVDLARTSGRKDVHLLLPPVDIDFNSPFAVDPNAFAVTASVRTTTNLVTVSRLDPWMKGDSLRRTIDAVKRWERPSHLGSSSLVMDRRAPNLRACRRTLTPSFVAKPSLCR